MELSATGVERNERLQPGEWSERDDRFMAVAIGEARKALEKREVPVGTVVVYDDEIIGRGHNMREGTGDPTSHAEMVALRDAAIRRKGWRLEGATLYVTLEPCIMCMGAILQARLSTLVFGCYDPKGGACGSLYDLSSDDRLNHAVTVTSGVRADEAGELLANFFAGLRKKGSEGGSQRINGEGNGLR
ncbi:MAG: tRNA adenosine(34) deaminase TadA [Thermodesulfobacteriota bacterium]